MGFLVNATQKIKVKVEKKRKKLLECKSNKLKKEKTKVTMENPDTIDEIAEEMKKKLVPEESKEEYEKVYQEFKIWRAMKGVVVTNENVLLSYVDDLECRYAISTIKKKLSIIKTMLRIHEKIESRNFVQLQAYLNKQLSKHVPKKAEALTAENYNDFLHNASDDEFLDVKVS